MAKTASIVKNDLHEKMNAIAFTIKDIGTQYLQKIFQSAPENSTGKKYKGAKGLPGVLESEIVSDLQYLVKNTRIGKFSKQLAFEKAMDSIKIDIQNSVNALKKILSRKNASEYKDLFDPSIWEDAVKALIDSIEVEAKEEPPHVIEVTIDNAKVGEILRSVSGTLWSSYLSTKVDHILSNSDFVGIERIITLMNNNYKLKSILPNPGTSSKFKFTQLVNISVDKLHNSLTNEHVKIVNEILEVYKKGVSTMLLEFLKDIDNTVFSYKKLYDDKNEAIAFFIKSRRKKDFYEVEKEAVLNFIHTAKNFDFEEAIRDVNARIHANKKVCTREHMQTLLEIMHEEEILPKGFSLPKFDIQEAPSEPIEASKDISEMQSQEKAVEQKETAALPERTEEISVDVVEVVSIEPSIEEEVVVISEVMEEKIEIPTAELGALEDLDLLGAKGSSGGSIVHALVASSIFPSKREKANAAKKTLPREAEHVYAEFLKIKEVFVANLISDGERLRDSLLSIQEESEKLLGIMKNTSVLKRKWDVFLADFEDEDVVGVVRDIITVHFDQLRTIQKELLKLNQTLLEESNSNKKPKISILKAIERNNAHRQDIITELRESYDSFMSFTDLLNEHEGFSLDRKVNLQQAIKAAEEEIHSILGKTKEFPYSIMFNDTTLIDVNMLETALSTSKDNLLKLEKILTEIGQLQFLDKTLNYIHIKKEAVSRDTFIEMVSLLK